MYSQFHKQIAGFTDKSAGDPTIQSPQVHTKYREFVRTVSYHDQDGSPTNHVKTNIPNNMPTPVDKLSRPIIMESPSPAKSVEGHHQDHIRFTTTETPPGEQSHTRFLLGPSQLVSHRLGSAVDLKSNVSTKFSAVFVDSNAARFRKRMLEDEAASRINAIGMDNWLNEEYDEDYHSSQFLAAEESPQRALSPISKGPSSPEGSEITSTSTLRDAASILGDQDNGSALNTGSDSKVDYDPDEPLDRLHLRRELLNNIRALSRASLESNFFEELYARNGGKEGDSFLSSTIPQGDRVDVWVKESWENGGSPGDDRQREPAISSLFHEVAGGNNRGAFERDPANNKRPFSFSSTTENKECSNNHNVRSGVVAPPTGLGKSGAGNNVKVSKRMGMSKSQDGITNNNGPADYVSFCCDHCELLNASIL